MWPSSEIFKRTKRCHLMIRSVRFDIFSCPRPNSRHNSLHRLAFSMRLEKMATVFFVGPLESPTVVFSSYPQQLTISRGLLIVNRVLSDDLIISARESHHTPATLIVPCSQPAFDKLMEVMKMAGLLHRTAPPLLSARPSRTIKEPTDSEYLSSRTSLQGYASIYTIHYDRSMCGNAEKQRAPRW
uniref:Uncharacterized protein n=1 Tax=Haemonchus contortus TaxID=6289 RepID=A0A7I4YTH3_HAECO